MMLWLLSAISAYFLLAIVSIGDRFLLVGPLPSPKTYAFFIAVLGTVFIPILLPFGFFIPDNLSIFLSLAAGFFWILALVVYFEAISKSEVSRVVPAVGAFVPIFTLLAAFFVWQEVLSLKEFIAFLILIFGGILITSSKINPGYFLRDHILRWILLTALIFAVSFVLTKSVFSRESFINGFIWMRIGGFLMALILLFSREVRDAIFIQKVGLQKRVLIPFILFQSAGGAGFILQNLSVSLVKFSQVPLVNVLEGTRYLFLFFFIWLAARWKPELLKEEMRGGMLRQKIIAGAIIILGITLLAV